jgi:hypothetical protein
VDKLRWSFFHSYGRRLLAGICLGEDASYTYASGYSGGGLGGLGGPLGGGMAYPVVGQDLIDLGLALRRQSRLSAAAAICATLAAFLGAASLAAGNTTRGDITLMCSTRDAIHAATLASRTVASPARDVHVFASIEEPRFSRPVISCW